MPSWKLCDSPNVRRVSFGMFYGNRLVRHDESSPFENHPYHNTAFNLFRDYSSMFHIDNGNEHWRLQYENCPWDVYDSY